MSTLERTLTLTLTLTLTSTTLTLTVPWPGPTQGSMVVAVGGESDGSCLLLVLAAAVRLVARLTSLPLPCISPVSHHVSLYLPGVPRRLVQRRHTRVRPRPRVRVRDGCRCRYTWGALSPRLLRLQVCDAAALPAQHGAAARLQAALLRLRLLMNY